MEPKTRPSLEEAKACFYSWRLLEAYHIFRRYFDRIPFKPEKDHALHIGMFARILVELGKEYELKFYREELERIAETSQIPEVIYPLAVVYAFSSPPNPKRAKELVEEILRNPVAKEYHCKAKMMLADYYLNVGDHDACCLVVESIEEPSDLVLKDLRIIWRANAERLRKRYKEAHQLLSELIGRVPPESNWYVYFSARLIQALLYVEEQKFNRASNALKEIRHLFEGHHFKSVEDQLKGLEENLLKMAKQEILRFCVRDSRLKITYDKRSLTFSGNSPLRKLLLLLLENKVLEKEAIVESIYHRRYSPNADDNVIDAQMVSLKKQLKSIGLPECAIQTHREGYCFLPQREKVVS